MHDAYKYLVKLFIKFLLKLLALQSGALREDLENPIDGFQPFWGYPHPESRWKYKWRFMHLWWRFKNEKH